jgi:hypothetical protein
MQERRGQSRTKVEASGRILARDVDQLLSCTVRDMTSKGLRLEFSVAEPLQTEFDFSFDNFRTTHECRLVWSRKNVAGVVFVKKASS